MTMAQCRYIGAVSFLLFIGCSLFPDSTEHHSSYYGGFLIDSVHVGILRNDWDSFVTGDNIYAARGDRNCEQRLFICDIRTRELKEVPEFYKKVESLSGLDNAHCSYPWLLYTTMVGMYTYAAVFNLETHSNEITDLIVGSIDYISKNGRYIVSVNEIYDRIEKKKLDHKYSTLTAILCFDENSESAYLISGQYFIRYSYRLNKTDTLNVIGDFGLFNFSSFMGVTVWGKGVRNEFYYCLLDSLKIPVQQIGFKAFIIPSREISSLDIDLNSGNYVKNNLIGNIYSDSSEYVIDSWRKL